MATGYEIPAYSERVRRQSHTTFELTLAATQYAFNHLALEEIGQEISLSTKTPFCYEMYPPNPHRRLFFSSMTYFLPNGDAALYFPWLPCKNDKFSPEDLEVQVWADPFVSEHALNGLIKTLVSAMQQKLSHGFLGAVSKKSRMRERFSGALASLTVRGLQHSRQAHP